MRLNGHSPRELQLHVRQERMALVREKTELVKRLKVIDERLMELDTADNFLEGEL